MCTHSDLSDNTLSYLRFGLLDALTSLGSLCVGWWWWWLPVMPWGLS